MATIQKIIKRKQKGYTIIEVMIVLSISTLLFAGAVAGYAHQNSKTQFTNGVRDMENKIQDILNDVSTGFYPQANNFSCVRSGSPAVPEILDEADAPGAEQGTNQDCIFLGKAVDINDGAMNSYTMVGLRNSSINADEPSANLEDAQARTIKSSIAGTFASLPLNASIHIVKIIPDNQGFAVVSGFGNGDDGGAGATTSQVAIAPISSPYNFEFATDQVVSTTNLNTPITICISEPGGGRHASIKIGEGAQTNIETTIDDWAPECS
jgi:prepilin-type N-terminal cleavage/methylation domain-containing protein